MVLARASAISNVRGDTPLHTFCNGARCPTTSKLEAQNALCGVCDLGDAWLLDVCDV